MNQPEDIIKQLEDENNLLKEKLSQLEADQKKCEKESEKKPYQIDNEGVFRSIFDNSMDGIFLIEEDGVITEWNRGFEDMLGISRNEVIGKNIWDAFHLMLLEEEYSKEEIEEMSNKLKDIITHQEQTTFVRKIVNFKTKQKRMIHTLYFPVNQRENTTICVICRDITVSINKENELLMEKERLQSLADNYPDGCLYCATFDPYTKDFRLTYLSKTWETITGTSIETALNDKNVVFGLIFPEDLPLLMNAIAKSAETMTILKIEVRLCINDESINWVLISSTPRIKDDLVVWDGYIHNITDRKNIELELEANRKELEFLVNERTAELEATNEELYATNEELYATNEEFASTNEELHNKNQQLNQEMAARKEMMQKLEESENKFRNFIAQSFEGIVIMNEEGQIVEWNPRQEQITNISHKEAVGEYSWNLYRKLIPNDLAEELTKQFRQQIFRLIDPEEKQKMPEETEHVIYVSNMEEKRYVTVTNFPIALEDKYYLGQIVHDTTERKLVDFELERYRTQLEEMVATQTKKLTESKMRLTSLSDNLPGGVIYQMYGKAGEALRFTYISARFKDMFHIPVDDVMEDCSLFFRMFHPDDQEKVLELFTSDQSGFVNAECRICFDTGETIWILLRSSCHAHDDQSHIWDGFMVDVTDRKITEQELDETRARQNILIKVLQIIQSVENLPDAINTSLTEIGKYAGVSRSYIFEKAPDSKYIPNTYEWCNEGVVPEIDNLQELTYEDLKTWFDIFDRGEIICTHDIATLAPEVYDILEPQGIKSILVLPLEANGVIYGFVGFDECKRHKKWKQPEVELLISLSQIISSATRRFQAEKSIQLSQQTMRTVLDNINASIYVANFDTHELLFANKMVKDQMGEDIEGKACFKVLQNGILEPCEFCPKPKLLDKEKKPTGLYRWEFKNRTLNKWFECTDVAIKWVDGRLVHMEYATDITERRMAEEAVRRSEELYRQLTVASPDAIIVCNPKGRIVFISPKARELFMIGNDFDFTDVRIARYVHPHDLRTSFGLFNSLMEDNVTFMPQLLLIRENGSDFFGEISAASVKDEQGQITSIIMVIRDITERKMNEMELIQAKEKAEESDKLKSSFLANMSHEIRTPINGIIGFLSFLADENLSPKRRQEYITVVNNSSSALVKLIDDIIDVAKIEAKQLSIRPIDFHLNGFMNEVLIFFDTYLQANNKDKVAILLDDSGFIDPCEIFVDPMRLRQILTNLIGNAIKFTEKGYIGFGYRMMPPDKLEFWVEDSGIGLAADQLEVIFERFRQVELTNSRKYGGTGLGLTISRSLAQIMGGDITVESVPNEGSTFRFTISYLPIDSNDKEHFDENAEPLTGNLPFEGVAIVVVEPEPMTYRYYERLLASTGATLIQVQSAKQWIDTVSQRKHINVVLANAKVFQNEDDGMIRQVRSVRAGLPLVLIVPERNEYYDHIINTCQCNRVLEKTPNFEQLFDALIKYM